jgi:hypothetical protein
MDVSRQRSSTGRRSRPQRRPWVSIAIMSRHATGTEAGLSEFGASTAETHPSSCSRARRAGQLAVARRVAGSGCRDSGSRFRAATGAQAEAYGAAASAPGDADLRSMTGPPQPREWQFPQNLNPRAAAAAVTTTTCGRPPPWIRPVQGGGGFPERDPAPRPPDSKSVDRPPAVTGPSSRRLLSPWPGLLGRRPLAVAFGLSAEPPPLLAGQVGGLVADRPLPEHPLRPARPVFHI